MKRNSLPTDIVACGGYGGRGDSVGLSVLVERATRNGGNHREISVKRKRHRTNSVSSSKDKRAAVRQLPGRINGGCSGRGKTLLITYLP